MSNEEETFKMGAILPYVAVVVATMMMVGVIVFVVRGSMVRKEVRCTANEWTTVINNYATGVPATWTLRFEGADGEPISGTYKEQRAFWIFPMKAKTGVLEPEMVFSRDWINALYSLKVRTGTDGFVRID